jgi:hypothetical protein
MSTARPTEPKTTDTATEECPYCFTGIHPQATRCPSCGGERRFCPQCQSLQGMTSKQKFVGLVRGGTKTRFNCMGCNSVLDGPRW